MGEYMRACEMRDVFLRASSLVLLRRWADDVRFPQQKKPASEEEGKKRRSTKQDMLRGTPYLHCPENFPRPVPGLVGGGGGGVLVAKRKKKSGGRACMLLRTYLSLDAEYEPQYSIRRASLLVKATAEPPGDDGRRCVSICG